MKSVLPRIFLQRKKIGKEPIKSVLPRIFLRCKKIDIKNYQL